uniref:glutaredoxin family protein n=1 Tax=Marinobacterium profundum TaxID=1714300 RepID=UPI00082BA054|nr:glutaredoxin family protein [Marinobacterium profundum]
MRHFLLMSTSGCHLCDEAIEIIVTALDPAQHSVDEVDIADEDALVELYGVRIPVLLDEASGAELGWPFDRAGLLAFIGGLS